MAAPVRAQGSRSESQPGAPGPGGDHPTRSDQPRGRARGPSGWPRPLRRLGLRARITVMFGLGALGLSAVMGIGTYLVARQFTLHQREAEAVRQTFVDASMVRSSLLVPDVDVVSLLESLDTSGSRSVIEFRGRWFSASVPVGEGSIPLAMRQLVLSGTAATELLRSGTEPTLAIGVPIPSVGAAYFELVSLGDVARSLQILALTLVGAAAVTTVAGAVVGRWASGRALGPLAAVSHAAEVIAGGQLDTRLAVAEDPDLRPLAASFNRMTDALKERIEREARFTSDVSHELRSPLTTLATSLDVLEAHAGDLGERGATALRLLADEVRHFQQMVEDLLEISRADTGTAQLAAEEVEVAELVDHLATAGGARGVPVSVDPAVARLRLWVDKRRIDRVVANLVTNAARYAGGARLLSASPGPGRPEQPGASGPGVEVEPAPTTTRGWVHLSVSDHGPEIEPAERHRIFERFYRGQAAGRRGAAEGTGLGLALVAEHVRLHGGRVWVEADPEGGNRFVVALPAAPAREEADDDRGSER
jgi:two-component system sensor histidine kinase MtrB